MINTTPCYVVSAYFSTSRCWLQLVFSSKNKMKGTQSKLYFAKTMEKGNVTLKKLTLFVKNLKYQLNFHTFHL